MGGRLKRKDTVQKDKRIKREEEQWGGKFERKKDKRKREEDERKCIEWESKKVENAERLSRSKRKFIEET